MRRKHQVPSPSKKVHLVMNERAENRLLRIAVSVKEKTGDHVSASYLLHDLVMNADANAIAERVRGRK